MPIRSVVDGNNIIYKDGEWAFEDDGSPLGEYKSECLDCGLGYDDFQIDFILSEKDWKIIHPDEHGVLCPSCIVSRISRTTKAISLKGKIVFPEDYD